MCFFNTVLLIIIEKYFFYCNNFANVTVELVITITDFMIFENVLLQISSPHVYNKFLQLQKSLTEKRLKKKVTCEFSPRNLLRNCKNIFCQSF